MRKIPHKTLGKAVFPVAGLGTRFLPATKASPKEMLPVVDKPLIQYAVEEAYEAGIRDMIFVTGRNKRAIEDHFDTAYELETELHNAGKHAMLDFVRGISPPDMHCIFVRQPRALGLGHAVLCAAPLVGPHESFAVLLADDLMTGEPQADGTAGPGVLAQMKAAWQRSDAAALLAVQEVPAAQVQRYGIVAPAPDAPPGFGPGQPALLPIADIVEKPDPQNAPSRLAVCGRYILPARIFAHLRGQAPGAGGEVQLTDAIAALLPEQRACAFGYRGKRYDCGSKDGFLQATVELALQHPEVGASFRQLIKNMSL